MWVHLPDVLEFFFVAHPPSGRCEGEEHNRVMYFYPKGETLDRQTEITGFAEAVVNFTDNFVNPNDHAEKPEFPHRTVLTQKIQCAAAEYSIFLPAIQNVLTDTYKMFRLFFGKFRPFRKNDQQKFTERLEYFFGRYLPLLKLHRVYLSDPMPLLDYLSGAAFLRLDGPTYLNVVTMSSELLEEFPIIQKLLVLYQFYECRKFRLSQGRFLRGPSDLCVDTPLVGHDALPTVFLFNCVEDDDTEELVKYQMMVYRCLNATVCMFTDQEVTRMLMRNIDAYLGSELSTVASQIGD
ncbi:unnamed protein product [Angiostrongylus costaricensis]|uniref:Intu_longin_1 domain-containing protein n=1 Tax=Angiostrongylus costaricensis TaxID=334426 RepID=A0A0R3PKN7_ANGCS|nr:unnamed protein product [Angiostrongylus costaricensis]